MKKIVFSVSLLTCLSACNITPQQGLQGLGSMVVQEKYKEQTSRVCAQQTDGALRLQCQKQAQKEFQKFRKQTEDNP